jgi:signal-transduction protein with cAMP-binding, CBS, and nucleotidyltransferase domain
VGAVHTRPHATPPACTPTRTEMTMHPAHPAFDGDAQAPHARTLRSMELFAGLPEAEIEEMAQRGTVSTAHPGQVVQAQDVPVRMWHVILGGHAVVQRDGTPIGLLGRGESWSEHSLLNQLRSPIAVVAFSPLTLLTLGQRSFFEIPDHHPVLAGRLVARSATSADRLAVPVCNALRQGPDTERTGGRHRDRYH